jgi:hypothetical protein
MRSFAAPCAALAGLFLAVLAHAETPATATPAPAPSAATSTAATATPAASASSAPDGPVVVPGDSDQPTLEPIPNARDLLGGHVVLGAGIGAKWPFGSLNDAQSQRNQIGPGLALNLDLGVGISRNVALGAWGEFDDYSAPPDCPTCSTQSFAGGPFLRYHVAQGTRFDPWGMFAIGVRQTNVDTDHHTTDHYFGAELLRLSLGADWYASSNVAFGPYVELNMGAYSTFALERLHTDLGTGLRLTLDFPGK